MLFLLYNIYPPYVITKNTLIFNPVTALDEGTYRCKLTNTYKTNQPGTTYSNPVNLKPITTAEFKF